MIPNETAFEHVELVSRQNGSSFHASIEFRSRESELAELVSRYAMVGVAKVSMPAGGAKA